MTEQLVSIGMPVYNGERYLESAIQSNLEQTYSRFELIISDNASSDRTEEICRDYANADDRIRYFRNPENVGAAENFNLVFRHSKGEYFRWSNADDLIVPELLEKLVPILDSRPDVVLAYGRTNLIDESGALLEEYADNLDLQDDDVETRYRRYFDQVRLTNVIYGLMRSKAVGQTRLMADGRIHAGDISFMAALVLRGKFVEIPDHLFSRRMHAGAYSASTDADEQAEFWTASSTGAAFPFLRSVGNDLGAILSAPITLGSKLSLCSFTAKRVYWSKSLVASDFREVASK